MIARQPGPGAAERFPDDLIALQQQWTRLFNHLVVRAPAGAAGHELRQELLALSFRVNGHPHWGREWSMARRSVLQRVASTAPGGEEQLVTRYIDGRFVVQRPDGTPVRG
ncbi:hypothetical protein ACFXD5_38545 [Streptomyces sp. NPDC059385]|uniref:hypothetical protein n=1 Tax=Streptomyces sp. NPDC059385 TaxID=3346817 RepID=UPI0036AFDA5C